MLHKR